MSTARVVRVLLRLCMLVLTLNECVLTCWQGCSYCLIVGTSVHYKPPDSLRLQQGLQDDGVTDSLQQLMQRDRG